MGALWIASPSAGAAACPPIQNKPGAIPHVQYDGVQHLTYCYGPVTVKPGQNIIRLNGTNLFPQQPGYITRFDPELVYPNGTVPRVDVLHLHHAVWVVNGNPQFAAGEEKTIVQMPKGFGWRSTPIRQLAAQRHDPRPRRNAGDRVHRVEDRLRARHGSPAAASIAPGAHQVDGRLRAQPAGRASRARSIPSSTPLRRMGQDGRYTFPDQATGAQRNLIGSIARPGRPTTR